MSDAASATSRVVGKREVGTDSDGEVGQHSFNDPQEPSVLVLSHSTPCGVSDFGPSLLVVVIELLEGLSANVQASGANPD